MTRWAPRVLLLALAAAGCFTKVAWLSDGMHVAYQQDDGVFLVDLAGQRARLCTLTEPVGLLVAAPARNLLAVVDGPHAGRLRILDGHGAVVWSATLVGGDPWMLPGSWSRDGGLLVVGDTKDRSLVVDLDARTQWRGPAAECAGITRNGEVVFIGEFTGPKKDRSAVQTFSRAGTKKAASTWTLPDDFAGAAFLTVAADAGRAMVFSSGQRKEVRLIDPAGRTLFKRTCDFQAQGPGEDSFVSLEGKGYLLVRMSGGPDLNLNPIHRKVLQVELGWQLVDPALAAEPFDPNLYDSWPAWSPDGGKLALLTKHTLCVADLKTDEVVALAKW